jgi:hypothetical protein
LFHKFLEKRDPHITTNRLFLTPNPFWQKENCVGFFKNVPLGRNTISTWTNDAAEKIGIDTKRVKISNQSNRSSAVSNLAKQGVPEIQISKITGHSSMNSISSYLKMNQEHHQEIIAKMRCEEPKKEGMVSFTNCQFTPCNFS